MTTLITDVARGSVDVHKDRQTYVEYIRRWGGSTSDAILDPECHFFTVPGVEGLLSYRQSFGAAVLYGDPICAPEDIETLITAFQKFCQKKNWSMVFVATSEKYAQWLLKHRIANASMEFGEQLWLNPQNLIASEKSGLLGRKTRHAQREGVQVREYRGNDKALENELEGIGERWLNSRRGPQIHISRIFLFDDVKGKRWFYAHDGSKALGVVVLSRLESYDGWLLNHLMPLSEAPNGTSELLVTSALETVGREGCSYVTVGPVPGKYSGEMQGIGAITAVLTRMAFYAAKAIFSLDGARKYWEKFNPAAERTFLLFSKRGIGVKEVRAISRAMNVF